MSKNHGDAAGKPYERQGRGPMGPGRGPGGPGRPMITEKPKDFKKTWKKLIKYCIKFLPGIIAAVVFAIVGTIFQIIGPDKLKEITNEIMKGFPVTVNGVPVVNEIDMGRIKTITVSLAILYIFSFVLNFLQGYIMTTITQRTGKMMRTGISQKINRLPFKYFDKVSRGDVLSRITNDVDTIGQSMSQSVSMLATSVVMLAGSVIMMIYNNLILAATAIGSGIIGFFIMSLIMKKSQKYFVEQQKLLGELNGHIEEMYSGHTVVKVYNGGRDAKEKFEKLNNGLYGSCMKSQFLSGLMMPLMMFIGNFGYVAVCVAGGILVMNDVISFGVIVAFTVYIRLFTQPLSQMAQAIQSLQGAAAAGERFFEFIEEEELSDESSKKSSLSNVKGEVDFRRISFGYTPDKPVIHDFSAKISAGKKIAIVGPTGAGKTTMVNLLMRFYEPDSGDILLDGISVKDVPRENVHEQFCMVLQDTWLFEGTIKENIVYCKEGVSDKQVEDAGKAVGIHHFIKTLPDGYNTVLNDKAALSQGQKQLITIARAMIQNAPMLILDEATSSVDTRTELLIQEAMDKLTEGRTSFIIAHRLSTIKNADLILVMNDGDIVESGTHNELLNKGGFYADMYNSQFDRDCAADG